MSELESPVRLASVVRPEPPGLDDPAELYHEASKLTPATVGRDVAGALRLAASPDLQRASALASQRHRERPLVSLGRLLALDAALGETLERRRSAREFGPGALSCDEVGTLLHAAYGATGSFGDVKLRSAPSAGALYPLDLFAACVRVEGLATDVYRYDPLERALEPQGVDPRDVAAATPYDELVASAAVAVLVTATFWRMRFKYGLRAYRFTLLEAGHVGQNLLLAAEALGLAAVPLGGFFDGRLDATLELDGVERGSLYLVCIGRCP